MTSRDEALVHVTMVKKRLPSGEACRKCIDVEQVLRTRGLWSRIDDVVWAIEADSSSAGALLSERFGVGQAPFFVVRNGAGQEKAIVSALSLARLLGGEVESSSARAVEHVATGAARADAAELVRRLGSVSPEEIIHHALLTFGAQTRIAFSGAEDVVLLEMASRSGLPFRVFCLDTGRLHPETYRFVEQVRKRYALDIDMVMAEASAVQSFVRQKGLFSFYEDGHAECCAVRKVAPLRRFLEHCPAWITGQRRDQSQQTRVELPVAQEDHTASPRAVPLIKLNPLATWSSAQVWSYIREHELPYNELHARGFTSIGCEPCTRGVLPGQHEREGRWWWESGVSKECGIHRAER
jgi:phosphoadenosine phosphosulfate reductase